MDVDVDVDVDDVITAKPFLPAILQDHSTSDNAGLKVTKHVTGDDDEWEDLSEDAHSRGEEREDEETTQLSNNLKKLNIEQS